MVFLYISLIICIFGIISNVSMAILLTRPRLDTTINRMLAFVTLSDAFLMCSYIIYVGHFELGDRTGCPVSMLTYGWVLFQLLHSNWSVYLRAFSLWLSVVMAGYRKHVLSITTPRRHTKSRLATKLTLIVAVAVLIMCVPIFLQNTIVEGPRAPENNSVCPRNHSKYYTLRIPKYALLNDRLLLKAAYWTNGLLLKLVPLAALTYYLVRLVALVYSTHQKRQRQLFKNRPYPTAGCRQSFVHNSEGGSFRSVMMPTSIILVTILLTTVLCELPNAILSVMSGLLAHVFIRSTYMYLGEMMDLLSLFSCTSSSILYFMMSRSLRKAFVDTFCYKFWTCRNRRAGNEGAINDGLECVVLSDKDNRVV